MPKKIDLFQPSSNGDIITVQELQGLVDRYKKERYKLITKHVTDDSRGVWLSKEKLLEFFNNNPDATGVRMYYGVIDDPNTGLEKGVHNVVMVPTKKIGTDNTDMLTGNDWVIVLQNNPNGGNLAGNAVAAATLTEPGGAICPPPKKLCGGSELVY